MFEPSNVVLIFFLGGITWSLKIFLFSVKTHDLTKMVEFSDDDTHAPPLCILVYRVYSVDRSLFLQYFHVRALDSLSGF